MKMKKVEECGVIAVLGICLVLVGFISSADATADWSQVAVNFVPKGVTIGRYEVDAPNGHIEFRGNVTGYLTFFCNVLSPADNGNPTWTKMYVSYVDESSSSDVRVELHQKGKNDGVSTVVVTYNSVDVQGGVTEGYVDLPPNFTWDFTTYAYYMVIRLRRNLVNVNPEIHIVSLKD